MNLFSFKTLIAFFACFVTSSVLTSQDEIVPLWPGGIPFENDLDEETFENPNIGRIVQKVHTPEILAYHADPAIANGTAVLICPGGGYTLLAWDWEGTKIAEMLNRMGISAFVLKYRLPHWENEKVSSAVALQDAQRAIRTIRNNASRWKINPDRVGVMGFSAGGHLAASLSTHWDRGRENSYEQIEKIPCRPDFSILIYPVITMDEEVAHMGSRINLISEDPTPKMIHYYSTEVQVNEESPPTILFHASDDTAVLPENSIRYYQSLIKNGVPAALHVFESGGHGFSTGREGESSSQWPEILRDWMDNAGLLSKPIRALIIDGQSNHENWQSISTALSSYLENTGHFLVSTARTPPVNGNMEQFQPQFSQYDVVISNYNGQRWSKATEDAFVQFVRSGGGFVSVHSANNAFPDWKEYNEIIGLGGWGNRSEKDGPYVYFDEGGNRKTDNGIGPGGSHGEQHEFVVQSRSPDHPIMKGLPGLWKHTKDELYDRLRGPARNLDILATSYSDAIYGGTGRHEPVLMTVHYGQGRVFHTTLGHNPYSVDCQGFKVTFIRGVEWAASGEVVTSQFSEFPSEEMSKTAK